MNNIKKINPNISEIATGTPGWKINNQHFVGGIGGASLKNNKIINSLINRSITSISIPNIKKIRDHAFSYCESLTSVTIPNSVTSIGSHAFFYCSSLTSIAIPNSVTSIGNSAFQYCTSLTSVIIPNSVTSIGSNIFGSCTALTTCTLGSGFSCTGLSLSNSRNLTHDSIVNMFNALAIVTGTYTLTLGSTNLAKLTAEEKAIATNKGWTLK